MYTPMQPHSNSSISNYDAYYSPNNFSADGDFLRININPRSNRNSKNYTALHTYRGEVMQAAQRRDISRLKIIIATLIHHHRLKAAELNSCLVLHHVAWTGELNDIAEYLLNVGCDPFFPDINGDTVFHYTVRGCNMKLLRAFFSVYSYQIFEVLNNNHFNLFLTAAAEGPDEKAYEILNMVEWLYLNGCSLESQDANGKTGLMWACQRGSLTLVQWFLSRGVNLSHRDHNGRTVVHMACLSGDEDTLRTICDKGAINLLFCESNDDRDNNTALKICWNKGHFFLGLSLRQWYFQKNVFGCMKLFKNYYAWYYWFLMSMNISIFWSISSTLINYHYYYWYHCTIFLLFFIMSQTFWIMAFASDPGYVKVRVIPDQSYRCSPSLKYDLNQKLVVNYRITSACHKLQLLERESCNIGMELAALNRHYEIRNGHSNKFSPEISKLFDSYVIKIQEIREQMVKLMDRVGAERRISCPKGYAKEVMEGNPKKLCLTCRIIKPFRAHHCGDCAHCVNRFDHHCIWVDNCIGLGNQRSFFFFLLTLSVTIIYLWVLVGFYYKIRLLNRSKFSIDALTEPLFYVALTNSILNLFWAGFVGYLLIRTFKSMCTNLTFYEYLKRPGHIQKRFGGQVYQCFWDLKDLTFLRVIRNIYSYCSLNNYWDYIDYPSHANISHDLADKDLMTNEPLMKSVLKDDNVATDFPMETQFLKHLSQT